MGHRVKLPGWPAAQLPITVVKCQVLPRWVPLWVLLALYGKWLHTAMGYRFGKLVGLPELPKYCGRVGYSTHCYAMSYQFGKLVGLPELGSSYRFRKCVASRATKYGWQHI